MFASTIKRRLPSLNVWQRMHWRTRSKEKGVWRVLTSHLYNRPVETFELQGADLIHPIV